MSPTEAVRLPGVGPDLGRLALGANRLGSALDKDASYALLDRFVEGGGTLVDTALVYADWLPDVERACSERTIGRWLADRGVGDEVVVATKGGHPDLGAPGVPRLDPRSLRADVERSLDHLGLDRLPLWWLHRDDPTTPVDEVVDILADLCEEGLVGAWGVANWTAGRLRAALEVAHAQGLAGPVASSEAFALAPPAPGALATDLVTLDPLLAALHQREGVPLVAYSTQAKGWFDKVALGREAGLARIYDHGDARAVAREVADAAARLGVSPTEVALAAVWLLPFPVVAVVGPGDADQLDSCRRAAELDLGDESERLAVLADAAVRAVPPR